MDSHFRNKPTTKVKFVQGEHKQNRTLVGLPVVLDPSHADTVPNYVTNLKEIDPDNEWVDEDTQVDDWAAKTLTAGDRARYRWCRTETLKEIASRVEELEEAIDERCGARTIAALQSHPHHGTRFLKEWIEDLAAGLDE